MPNTRLRWGDTKISSFSDGRACLVVQFLDQQGRMFEWVPLWSQVQTLVDRAANAEVVNKPNSEWLGGLAQTVHAVSEKLEAHHDAYKINGWLGRIDKGCLVFGSPDEETDPLPAAFPLTREFLDEWLDSHVSSLVINGYVVGLSKEKDMLVESGGGPFLFGGFGDPPKLVTRRVRLEYPPTGKPPTVLPPVTF
jgi:hypothetical protein